MTPQEFSKIASACTHFLPGHKRRSVQERMQEIAESPYADLRADMYGAGGFVAVFETEMAELLGKEAAVFMPSGTMAQQIALRIWSDRVGNKRVAFHPMCHLYTHEHMAFQELHHLEAALLGETDRLFTLEDLHCVELQLAAMLIELPQRDIGGQLPTWEELSAITSYAKDREIKLHLDGARLWECGPYYGRSYKEIAAEFDSIYVSCYKILGGLSGAVLSGPNDFIAEARIWMRRHGGNLPYMFPNAISAKLGMERHLPRMPEYVAKAAEVASILNGLDGVDVVPSLPPTNMMHLHFQAPREAVLGAVGAIAAREKCLLLPFVAEKDGVAFTELTIGDAALEIPAERIRSLFDEALKMAGKRVGL